MLTCVHCAVLHKAFHPVCLSVSVCLSVCPQTVLQHGTEMLNLCERLLQSSATGGSILPSSSHHTNYTVQDGLVHCTQLENKDINRNLKHAEHKDYHQVWRVYRSQHGLQFSTGTQTIYCCFQCLYFNLCFYFFPSVQHWCCHFTQ